MKVYKVELFPDEELNTKVKGSYVATGASIRFIEVDEMPADTETTFYFSTPGFAVRLVKLVLNSSDLFRDLLAARQANNNNNNNIKQ